MAENILHKLMYVVDEGFKPQGMKKKNKFIELLFWELFFVD